jgi:diaminopropionate ammonia-lyase
MMTAANEAAIRWLQNSRRRSGAGGAIPTFLSRAATERVRAFHATLPGYAPTPLRSLPRLAACLGVAGIHVKDESQRFGLKAFKALGASWAMACHVARRAEIAEEAIAFPALTDPEVRRRCGEIVFTTATDGNHGRGVAWTARMLGHRAVIYMPKGSSLRRVGHIRAEGAEVIVGDGNYDATVRLAAEAARTHGRVVIQDTAWPGYAEVPRRIMQGYGTLAAEALEQLAAQGAPPPSHILLQAGVGSLAAALHGAIRARLGPEPPRSLIVEPDQADCFFRSAEAADGRPRSVDGPLATIMAGLACGEPSPIAWEILEAGADAFFSCPDWTSAGGMRLLASPLPGDPPILSGESGAIGAGLLAALMTQPALVGARQALGLDAEARVLLFSTEGDTDPEAYRCIVWNGDIPGPVFTAADWPGEGG